MTLVQLFRYRYAEFPGNDFTGKSFIDSGNWVEINNLQRET
jgi:hypothetical protein